MIILTRFCSLSVFVGGSRGALLVGASRGHCRRGIVGLRGGHSDQRNDANGEELHFCFKC